MAAGLAQIMAEKKGLSNTTSELPSSQPSGASTPGSTDSYRTSGSDGSVNTAMSSGQSARRMNTGTQRLRIPLKSSGN